MNAKNTNLHKAKKEKNDEFYTQLDDISRELNHYREHFKGKVVLCNCDDPTWSNFWKYFHLNFNFLGLKKLISTHYDAENSTYKLEYFGEDDNDINVGTKTLLGGNGDFRNEECLELLKEADIVVTNPPFSLFREFVATLVKYDKKFLIIGNPNAITYKEMFPLIKDNKMWIGMKSMGTDMLFDVSEDYKKVLIETKKEGSGYRIIDGHFYGRAPAIWFTNLDHSKRHNGLKERDLIRTYNEKDYPKYDNYDAINVDKVLDIPGDYYGVMGVPITFLDKYNPEMFEIVKFRKGNDNNDLAVNGKCPYFRILIRRKENN